jgi:hypothetical protein
MTIDWSLALTIAVGMAIGNAVALVVAQVVAGRLNAWFMQRLSRRLVAGPSPLDVQGPSTLHYCPKCDRGSFVIRPDVEAPFGVTKARCRYCGETSPASDWKTEPTERAGE